MHCAMNTTRGIICSNGNGNGLGRSQEQMMRYIWRFENDPHPVWMSHSLRFIWILCEVCFCSTFLSFHLVDALFFFCCGSKPEERHCNRGNGWMRSLYKTAQQHQWHSKFCAVALGMGAHAELWQTHTEMTRTFTHTHTHTTTDILHCRPAEISYCATWLMSAVSQLAIRWKQYLRTNATNAIPIWRNGHVESKICRWCPFQ